jgi:hypothetical protein
MKRGNRMSIMKKLKEEIQAVALLTLYFGVWIGTLVLLKTLILAEYQIEFHGLSAALLGVLILAKVVLVLEHVSFPGAWVQKQPALVDVILRTILYMIGVFVVVLIEKSFEGRHAHDGFFPSMLSVFATAEGYKAMANVICITGALLFYNVFSTLKRVFGAGSLMQAFLKPLPE